MTALHPRERTLLLAHGSRDPAWAQPFEAVLREFHARFPDRDAALAYLQFMQPDLESALTTAGLQGIDHVRLVPLFLGNGRHLQCDVSDVVVRVRASQPNLRVSCADAAGLDSGVIRALVDYAADEASPPHG
ncbi:MAG: CbiX/SirB N-terminal domain-containing protein [Thiomonas sp.]